MKQASHIVLPCTFVGHYEAGHTLYVSLCPAIMKQARGKKGGSAGARRSVRNTRPSVRLVETDADVSRPAIEEMAELKRQNELLRQQLQQSVSLPATSSSPQQSSSLSPLPSSSSAAFPSALHPPLPQQSGSTLLLATPVVFTSQQSASVQPPSQDLLSNILQQMSAGQTAGEQPSLASFLVLGATLEPKIKAKICEGGYVDLGALCSPTDTTVSVAMGNNGQPSISLTPVRTKPPSSIYEWLRLFFTYASIYLQAHADEAASLMTYMQGSKFAVATVVNATMFCHLLPGCSSGSKHLLLP